MESPETCLTNVLKIVRKAHPIRSDPSEFNANCRDNHPPPKQENLSRIPYTLYRPSRPPNSNNNSNSNQNQNPKLPASLSRRDTNTLREAERILRSEGNIVLADRDKSELWLFQIEGFSPPSGNGKDGGDDNMEGEVQAQIAEEETEGKWKRIDTKLRDEWGLRESSSGTFLASTLAPPQPPLTATFQRSNSAGDALLSPHPQRGVSSTPVTPGFPTPMSGMFPPHTTTNTPTTIDLTDDPPEEIEPEDPYLAYKRFITAVLQSLEFELALSHGYTPLNIRTLVSPSSLRPSPAVRIATSEESTAQEDGRTKEDLLPSSPVLLPELIRPTVLALEAYLTTSGMLLIVPHTEIQPAIRRISSTSIVSSSLDGRDVYIAPWGEWGRLLPITEVEVISAGQKQKEEKWKKAVKSYLQDCGILSSTPRGDEWQRSVLEEAVEGGEWRRIEIWVPFKELPGMGMIVKVLWPEALLFIKASEDDTIPALSLEEKDKITDEEDKSVAGDDDGFWKSMFEDPEYARFASGGLSVSLASLVFEEGGKLRSSRKDLGMEWWDVPSAVDWAEGWLNDKDERERIVKTRMEEKKKQRQKEEQEKREKEKKEEEKPEPEAMDTKEDKGKLKILETKPTGGVYPTPPDGGQQQQQQMQGPGSTSSGSAPNTVTTISTAPTSAVPTEMELDWIGDGSGVPDPVPEQGRKQSDATAIGGLAGGTGEADLFGGDMDEDEMFGQGITEDDFAFFDNPGGLGEFGDDLEVGEDDVDMGLGEVDGMDLGMGLNTQPSGEVDLTMETPMPTREDMIIESSPVVPMTQPPTISIDMSKVDGHDLKTASAPVPEKPTEMEPHIQTPPLSPHRAIRLLVPEYSLSPNNQPHPTPPTTGGAVMKTPQHNGAPPPPAGGVSEAKRRMSLYSPITFTTNVEMADRKYAPGGRYFLPESIKEKEQREFESKQGKLETPKVPSTPGGGLKRKRSIFVRSVVVEENSEVAVPEVAEVVLADDAIMEESPEEEVGGEDSDSGWTEESSIESDADDETEEEEEEPGGRYYTSPLAVAYGGIAGGGTGRKRKWAFDDDGEASIAETMKRDVGIGAGGDVEAPGEMAPPPWEIMVPDSTDSSLIGVFANMSLETDALSLAGLGEGEFMAVSRLVREQVVSGTSKPLGNLLGGGAWETATEDDDEEWCLLRRRKCKDEGIVEEAVKGLFKGGGVVRCTLETYVAVADAVIEPPLLVGRAASMRPIAQPRRGVVPTLNKRPSDGAGINSAIFRLPPPHVHLHRAEQALEILPPALHFWETFGFGPCSGPKNVIGFCLHPVSKAMEDATDGFLERVSFSYESGRFGTHVRGRLDASGISNGALGIESKSGGKSLEKGVLALMDAMAEFGAVLANVADELQNIVVYVINPFEHPSAVVDICAGFVRMQRIYVAAVQGVMGARLNNLVLQIVPARFVTAKVGGVNRGQNEWATLAAEVYNRCIPTDGMGSLEEAQKTFSPSIYLARPPPKSIEFRLTTEPSPALLYENSILHVAYAQSIDERWVSVAWTDNWGEIQATESYCLGRKGCTVLRVFEDVCREIWIKTMEIVQLKKIHWRLMFVKVGAMMADEIDVWAQLSRSSKHSLTLLSTDVTPPLAVTPVLPPIVPTQFNPLVSTYTGTPPGVTTPTPGGSGSIVSPDQFGNAANTPSGDPLPELDPGSNLVDFGDEVWGVVCAHRWRRGLLLGQDDGGGFGGGCMGYLVKRGGTGEGDEMVVLGVEVVRGAGGGNTLLREVLGAYRDLAALGQFKGIVEMSGRGSVVPWHVKAAWKGVEALGLVM